MERHRHRYTQPARQQANPYARPQQQRQQSSATANGQPPSGSVPLLDSSWLPSSATVQAVAQRARHPQKQQRQAGADDEDECDGGPTGAVESDPRRLEQRQKQIALGKATDGYRNYTQRVPMSDRQHEYSAPSPLGLNLCSLRLHRCPRGSDRESSAPLCSAMSAVIAATQRSAMRRIRSRPTSIWLAPNAAGTGQTDNWPDTERALTHGTNAAANCAPAANDNGARHWSLFRHTETAS